MNPTKKFALSVILLIAASVFTIPSLIKDAKTDRQAQNARFVLFYGNTCPHCKIVEQYIDSNGLAKKLDIAQREVYEDDANHRDFLAKAEICRLDPGKLGVPMLWDAENKKCYEGDQPIIDLLKQLTGQP